MNQNTVDGRIGSHVRHNRQKQPTRPEPERPQDRPKQSRQARARKARRVAMVVTQTK